jgi:hypothetical protein
MKEYWSRDEAVVYIQSTSGKRSFVAGFAANSISDAAQALINTEAKIGQNKSQNT